MTILYHFDLFNGFLDKVKHFFKLDTDLESKNEI